MAKEVTAYQTVDGKLWSSRQMADDHDKQMLLGEYIADNTSCTQPTLLVAFIWENWSGLYRIMMGKELP